jgi:hypothetical protein
LSAHASLALDVITGAHDHKRVIREQFFPVMFITIHCDVIAMNEIFSAQKIQRLSVFSSARIIIRKSGADA